MLILVDLAIGSIIIALAFLIFTLGLKALKNSDKKDGQ